MNGDRIPFTLVGGYLGAGKTTLVNRLLTDAVGERIAVLVNDVGAINVDASAIADHDGDTLELTNGCVCCAIVDDFVTTLEVVRSRAPTPDRVVMELSGVAEPARLVPWANTTGFRLDGVIVVVDAEQFPDQIVRRYVKDAVEAQVRAADLIVVSKLDLVGRDGGDTADAVRRLIAERTSAPVLDAAVVPHRALFGLDRGDEHAAAGESPDAVPTPVATRVIDLAHVVDRAELDRVVAALPGEVVRAKGFAAVGGAVVEIQVVGRRRTVRPRPDLDPAGVDGRIVVIEIPSG